MDRQAAQRGMKATRFKMWGDHVLLMTAKGAMAVLRL
jgi:hypothetical protein